MNVLIQKLLNVFVNNAHMTYRPVTSWLSKLSELKDTKCFLVWKQPKITWRLLKTKHHCVTLVCGCITNDCRMLPARNCLSVRITWPVLLLNESGENNVSEKDQAVKSKTLYWCILVKQFDWHLFSSADPRGGRSSEQEEVQEDPEEVRWA